MIDAIKNMSEWSAIATEHQAEVHRACHEHGVDCSHLSQLLYAVNEFKGIEQDMNRCIARFLNAMKLLSATGGKLSEELGEDFTMPAPPVHVVEHDQCNIPVFDDKELN